MKARRHKRGASSGKARLRLQRAAAARKARMAAQAKPSASDDGAEYRRVVTEAHEWLADLRRRGHNVPPTDPDVKLIEDAFMALPVETRAAGRLPSP